jgi:hypothetical protein
VDLLDFPEVIELFLEEDPHFLALAIMALGGQLKLIIGVQVTIPETFINRIPQKK